MSVTWMAVCKPAGMSVHNAKGEDLVSFLKEELGNEQPYCINRLDFMTSGVVLIAKTKRSAAILSQALENRSVTKTYRALAKNSPKSALTLEGAGVWKWRLTKRAEGRKSPAGFWRQRVPCETSWQVIRLNVEKQLALLEIQPVTGRKHQIRKHAAMAGCPLIGDIRYGGANDSEPMALHAWRLEFIDPDLNEPVIVEAPLPARLL